MNPIPLLAAAGAALLLAASPAGAQGTIAFGQTVGGELTSDDPTFSDDSHFDLWRFEGRAGQRVVVTLRSTEFDAFLGVGPTVDEDCEACESDDDGAGDLDSRVRMTLPRDGTYEIAANSLGAGETGAYTLTLEDAGVAAPIAPVGEIRVGETVSGELDDEDPQADDGSYYETWTFRGAPGERIVIRLESPDFDTFVEWGRIDGSVWETLDSNDDEGGEGTDSRLEVQLGDDGVYHVRANSFQAGETGAYTLSVERG